MSKAIVLLSGGQDSATCLWWAKQNYNELLAVSIHYGQRHKAELDAGEAIAAAAGVPRRVLDLGFLGAIGGSALVDPALALAGSGGHADREMPGGPATPCS